MSAPPTPDEIDELARAIVGQERSSDRGRAWAQLAADAIRRAYEDRDNRHKHIKDAVQLDQRAEAADKASQNETLDHLRKLRDRGDSLVGRFRQLGRRPRIVN